MNPALLELQTADSRIAALKREKAALDNGSAARERRDELETQLSAAQTALREIEAQRTSAEADQSATETKIERQRTRLMNVSSAHEITALERDITGLSARRGELDEAILLAMDEVETLEKRVRGLEFQLGEARDETARIEDHFASETQRIDAALATVSAERAQIAAKLAPEEKTRYDQSFARHAGIAVSKVVNKACSACGTTLSAYALRDAPNEMFPTCEACGRLLYVE